MWKAIKYILVYFAFQLLAALVVVIPGTVMKADMSVMLVLIILLSSILFCWFIIRKGVVRLDKETFSVRAWTILLLAVVAQFLFLIPDVELIERLSLPNNLGDEFEKIGTTVWGLITIGIIAPVTEEMLFRGAVLHSLLDWEKLRSKPWLAVLLSALFFSLAHMNPAQMPGAFLMGMLLGWLYYRTGSLLPGIMAHAFNNSLACIGMMLSTEEEETETLAEWLGSPTWEFVLVAVSVLACAAVITVLVHEVNKHYEPRESDIVPKEL